MSKKRKIWKILADAKFSGDLIKGNGRKLKWYIAKYTKKANILTAIFGQTFLCLIITFFVALRKINLLWKIIAPTIIISDNPTHVVNLLYLLTEVGSESMIPKRPSKFYCTITALCLENVYRLNISDLLSTWAMRNMKLEYSTKLSCFTAIFNATCIAGLSFNVQSFDTPGSS